MSSGPSIEPTGIHFVKGLVRYCMRIGTYPIVNNRRNQIRGL